MTPDHLRALRLQRPNRISILAAARLSARRVERRLELKSRMAAWCEELDRNNAETLKKLEAEAIAMTSARKVERRRDAVMVVAWVLAVAAIAYFGVTYGH